MKNFYLTVVLCGAVLGGVIGCAVQPKAEDSKAAIEKSKTLSTVEEQAKYLVGQANAFVSSKDFNEALNTAKYVLSNLDAQSKEAQGIIEKATAELKKVAEQKAEDLKKTLGQ